MLDLWGFRRGRPQAVRPGRDDWRHAELAVRPMSINTARDPRYRRERSGGHGSTVPYLPPRLGLPARRTGRPVGHVPTRPAPKMSVSS